VNFIAQSEVAAGTTHDAVDEIETELPARLNEQARLFARTYDPRTGGYRVPVRDQMPRLTPEIVDGFRQSVPADAHQWDSIEVEVAQWLYSVAKLTSAKRILETGCSRGFSTCFLAAAVSGTKEGLVVTIDPAELWHLWDDSPLEGLIEWIPGYSTECVQTVDEVTQGAEFDLLFLDSLHSYPNLIAEIQIYERRLRDGGIIVMHDTMFYDCLGAVAAQMSSNPRYEVLSMRSPRTHGVRDGRRPGVTICTKISSDDERYPILLDPEYVAKFGYSEVVCLPGRMISDISVLDIARASSLGKIRI
jgi:predicted O-methyltransferase YrrM